MGYTHYFERTVSLSEDQAAQLCEDAAKIVTYWFDHTRNSAALFTRRENHPGKWDRYSENSEKQLKFSNLPTTEKRGWLVYGKKLKRFLSAPTKKLFLRRVLTFLFTETVFYSARRIMPTVLVLLCMACSTF